MEGCPINMLGEVCNEDDGGVVAGRSENFGQCFDRLRANPCIDEREFIRLVSGGVHRGWGVPGDGDRVAIVSEDGIESEAQIVIRFNHQYAKADERGGEGCHYVVQVRK